MIALSMVLLGGCHSHPSPETRAKPATWQVVGSWSGRGNAQTDSFDIGYEPCRIRWEARNETAPGQGRLRVTVNSSVSGRELAVPVDHRGVGHDIAYVSVDPHYSYLLIESSGVDWSVAVEELLARKN
jgi:hypothetical protein